MKSLYLITIVLLVGRTSGLACCAEKDYRLFPIGELEEKVVFVEFDLFRNCKQGAPGEPDQEFFTKGTVQLVQNRGDSLMLLHTVDTFDIVDCICTYKDYYAKTAYETKLAGSYEKALAIARQKTGFQLARPRTVVFNDTIDAQLLETISDSTYSQSVEYRELFRIDLELEEIISCYPTKAAEVRTYTTTNFTITILRLRCSFIDESSIVYNQKRFANIETAFWKEQAQWHGIAKDHWVVEQNNP